MIATLQIDKKKEELAIHCVIFTKEKLNIFLE